MWTVDDDRAYPGEHPLQPLWQLRGPQAASLVAGEGAQTHFFLLAVGVAAEPMLVRFANDESNRQENHRGGANASLRGSVRATSL